MEVDAPGSSREAKGSKRKTGKEVDDDEGPSRKKSKSKQAETGSRPQLNPSRGGRKQDRGVTSKAASKEDRGKRDRVGSAKGALEQDQGSSNFPEPGHDAKGSKGYVAVIPDIPQGAPKYVENVLTLCSWVEGDKRWEKLVESWLRFDEGAGFKPSTKELSRLPTTGRPKEVGTWVSHARAATFRPVVDLPRFADEFAVWWRGMQPEGREELEDEFIALTKPRTIDWGELRMSGPNGMVNVVGALAWWYSAVQGLPQVKSSKTGRSGQKRESELRKLNEALDEVCYVLDNLLK